MLNNQFKQLTVKEWFKLINACYPFVQHKTAKKMGLEIRDIVGLKLYTDHDALTREYRMAYRENQQDAVLRQQQFYHWNLLIFEACFKSQDVITEPLYHGVNGPFAIPTYAGTYYGPISTTTRFDV